MESFNDFMEARIEAASAYSRGNGQPVAAMTTTSEPASFFGPDGRMTSGGAAIASSFVEGAKTFGTGGSSEIEIIQSAEGGDIAWWAGIQRATVEIDGKIVPMALRITELFRREAGRWRLVHRHADMLRDGK